MVNPELATIRRHPVRVSLHDPLTRGMTVVDQRWVDGREVQALPMQWIEPILEVALEFLAPDLANTISPVLLLPVVILAEVSMLIYLLAKGVRTTTPGSAPQVAQAVSSSERSTVT